MDKCRLCLKSSKKLRSIYDYEDGIAFYNMLTYFTNIKIHRSSNIPDYICLSCRKKLKEAYTFKIDIERTEKILNGNAFSKKIHFNNIREIDLKIDYKTTAPVIDYFYQDLLKDETSIINYNDTIIRRLCEPVNIGQENQMSVKEFLNSVKIDSDDDYHDQDYQLDVEYNSDSDYIHDKILKESKKGNKKCQKTKGAPSHTNKKSKTLLKIPIKPTYLNDVRIDHSEKDINKPKKKYRYPVKSSVCPHCGKVFMTKHINVHILSHTGIRPYKCNECSKTFITEHFLKVHQKIHTAPKMFKCDVCIASFITKMALKLHTLVHTEEKQFTCEVCSKAFKRKCALQRHLLIHSFGKKAIQCELCPMTFHTKVNLRHHMRIHTGERPYKCELCAQPYSYKHDFNRHCLKKHGVFLKQRSVNIMNEEVLQQEQALMRELVLKAHNGIKKEDIPKVFDSSRGALAFAQAMKAVEGRQIPIT